MKKTLLSIVVSAMAICTNAQLRVNETGKVLVGDSVAAISAGLNVNGYGHSASPNQITQTTALRSFTTGNCRDNTGVKGEATNTPTFPSMPSFPFVVTLNCGVHGIAGSNEMNIGVLGGLSSSTTNGAGVYGTTATLPTTLTEGLYAGYFEGDTKVTGLMKGCLTNTVDITPPSTPVDMTSVLGGLSNVSVLKTDYLVPPFPGTLGNGDSPDAIIPSTESESPRHALLDVQSVKTAFPYLIKTDAQGTEYVNYTELIPILLKAIQELKEHVDELEGMTSEGTRMMAPSQGGISSVATPALPGACLFQNRPNPFSTQTEIRFTLPADVRDASICIFDMSGKMLKQVPITSDMQSVTVDGYELSAGMYLYSLVINGQEIDTKRMILSK